MNFISLTRFLFDWWHKATFTTWLSTFLYGEFVGEDQYGNKYFHKRQKRDKTSPHWERRSRWAIYNGVTEASAIPPEWNAWLQHTESDAPLIITKNIIGKKHINQTLLVLMVLIGLLVVYYLVKETKLLVIMNIGVQKIRIYRL